MSLLALAACKQGGTAHQEEQMQIVGVEVDSTRYGVALTIQDDSLVWLSEEGDTLKTCVGGAMVFGDMEPGNRLAVLYEQNNKKLAKSVIDMTQLMGRWVEPDAVDEGTFHGFELQEGGAANSINSRANHYVSWRIYNGKLLLVNSLDGMVDQDIPEDTFTIGYLSKDSLKVGNSLTKHFFRRSFGDDDDNMRDYDMYDSPDSHAFDPEGEAPEGDMEIPETDRLY